MIGCSQIRGEFIRGYACRNSEYSAASWNLIRERDEQLRGLNKRYNYVEPDGTVGIGCKSHIDQAYKQEYDEIERRFRKPYDSQLPALYQWCRDNGITVYEYLVLDGIRDEHLTALANRTAATEDWQLNAIQMRAGLEIRHMAKEFRIGEVRRRLDMMAQNQHYAAKRCRKQLEIRLWDFAAQKAVFNYGQEWKSALNKAFGHLEAL